MWDFPGSVIEPMSPALAGRFFKDEPPGKPTMEYYSATKILTNQTLPFLTAVLSTLIISLPLSFLGPLTNLSPVYDSHFLASSYNSVQFSHVRLFATPWTAARQASL